MASRSQRGGKTLDVSTLLGIIIGMAGVLGGLVLEGGKLADIAQLTGGIIVFGGTLGAVMVTTPPKTLIRALGSVKDLILQPKPNYSLIVDDLIEFGNRARRDGIVSLEQEVEHVEDPFLRKALSLGIDGTDLEEIRTTMDLEMELEEHEGRSTAKVYEAAGGYAPTIGILGAVLGLIQVMKHLDDINEVGHGIAVAFVATVYGVGSANLLFLPAANKLKSRVEQSLRTKRLMLEGVCSIVQGLHPKVIERKLEAYLRDEKAGGSKERSSARASQSRAAGRA